MRRSDQPIAIVGTLGVLLWCALALPALHAQARPAAVPLSPAPVTPVPADGAPTPVLPDPEPPPPSPTTTPPATITPATGTSATDRPLPEMHALMREVQRHQRALEAAQQDYIYRQARKVDELDSQGAVKRTRRSEYDVFWLNGVEIGKLISRDGVELTPDEQRKQSQRIDREVAAARKRRARADAKGEDTDSHGRELFRISALLEDGVFTHERREIQEGRSTIQVDFAGDPENRHNSPLVDMEGTLGIDEDDFTLIRSEGRFVRDFKLLGGLAVKIDAGTRFSYHARRVNGEVWLPADYRLTGEARVFVLLSGHVDFEEQDSDYRKFSAKSTILPGFTETPDEGAPKPPAPEPSSPR